MELSKVKINKEAKIYSLVEEVEVVVAAAFESLDSLIDKHDSVKLLCMPWYVLQELDTTDLVMPAKLNIEIFRADSKKISKS